MLRLTWSICILLLCVAGAVEAQEFSVVFTHGIRQSDSKGRGGRTEGCLLIHRSGDRISVCRFAARAEPATERDYFRGTMTPKQLDELIAFLDEIALYTLPREEPEGIEDLYGLATSLRVRHGERAWRNGEPPGGCIAGGTSKVRANAAEIERFKRAHARLLEVGALANEACDLAAFQSVYRPIYAAEQAAKEAERKR